jgi:hypothetical protein
MSAGARGRPVGSAKTGGRQPGTPNRSTQELRKKLATLGCDPLVGIAKIAENPNNSDELRLHAYNSLLPYLYPKRKPVGDSSDERMSVNTQPVTPEEALEFAQEVIALWGKREPPTTKIEGEPKLSIKEEKAEQDDEENGN